MKIVLTKCLSNNRKKFEMGSLNSRKVYSKEFKESAVGMVTEQHRKVSEVARDLGITEQMLHNWKRNLQDKNENAFPGKGRLRPE
jgi:transposase